MTCQLETEDLSVFGAHEIAASIKQAGATQLLSSEFNHLFDFVCTTCEQVFKSCTPIGVQKLASAGSDGKWERNVCRDVMRQLGSPASCLFLFYLLYIP